MIQMKLPDYMTPSHFVPMDKLPLTPSGKIDRKALPKPEGVINFAEEYIAPSDDLERKLTEIWRELLNTEKIGINDNFFTLGGHSLKATTLAFKIHKEFAVELPLREIFQSSTIKELAKRIKEGETSIYSAIRPTAEAEYYPVSSAQKRMYLLNMIEGQNTNYNMPGALTIEGVLDRVKLEGVFRSLLERHEALRTSFELIDGEPVQKVRQKVEFQMNYLETDAEKVKDLVNEFIKPFDLRQAPLFRITLVKISAEKHVLLYDMHHIIGDGTSMGVLVKEIPAIYNSEEITALRIQYKDFSVWQNELFKTGKIKKQEEYWLGRFAGEIPVLNMPADYSRPSTQSFEGDRIHFKADRIPREKLSSLEISTGTTLYMGLLSAYYILLFKYTGQEDIIVGSPIAGRPHADLWNIIGMFANTLAMRNYPEGRKTYREFLHEIKENSLQTFENQDYQFEELVEKLNLRRDLSRTPLFDTLFVLQNMDIEPIELNNLKLTPYYLKKNTAKFDITLISVETDGGIEFTLEYCTKLFKKETVERLAMHYLNILEEITANPEKRLAEIEMLSKEEKKRILIDFNGTEADYPKDKSIHELFEAWAERSPESIAVIFEDQQLTYRELNEKANQLARFLRDKGGKPGDIVAVMVERSIEMIIGIMGIIKAGGAYLPIDPGYPKQRIQFMLEDSNANILITQNHLKENDTFEQVVIDLSDEKIDGTDSSNLEVINGPHDLAYVIYTSGSTGKPKGVMVEHKNVLNLVSGLQRIIYDQYGLQLQVALIAPYVFDASVKQIFTSLLLGHKLFIVPKDICANGTALIHYYRKNKIDISDGTPEHISILTEALDSKKEDLTVKHFIIGGEVLLSEVLRRFYAKFRDEKPYITNVYGPTECCVDSTAYFIKDEKSLGFNSVSIGKPIDNTKIYILGKNKEVLPLLAVGEIYIAGEGVARGYLNRPELTAEKFIPISDFGFRISDLTDKTNLRPEIGNQSATKNEVLAISKFRNPQSAITRMYRTGDLARWLPDGNIEFLGRIDHQVKIRGYRIELGEIESRLLKQRG